MSPPGSQSNTPTLLIFFLDMYHFSKVCTNLFFPASARAQTVLNIMYERKKNTYEPPKTESNSNQDTTCIKAETNKLWLQLTQLLSDKLHQLICQKQGLLKRRFFLCQFIIYTFIRLLVCLLSRSEVWN